jgi:hypothetical protein
VVAIVVKQSMITKISVSPDIVEYGKSDKTTTQSTYQRREYSEYGILSRLCARDGDMVQLYNSQPETYFGISDLITGQYKSRDLSSAVACASM